MVERLWQRFLINADEIQNEYRDGTPVGFSFKTVPGGMGMSLSRIDNITVSVDGQEFDRKDLRLVLRGRTYTFDEMETMATVRWEFRERATVLVPLAGGLTGRGERRIDMSISVRKYNGICTIKAYTVLDM